MVKAIIFDLGGVCLSPCFGWKNRKKLAERFSIPFDEIERIYRALGRDINTGKKDILDFFTALKLAHLNINTEEGIAFVKSLNKADRSMLDLIKKLKTNYVVVALFNESRFFGEYRKETFGLNKYFHHFSPSYELGFQKPDTKAYTLTLERLGFSPSETLFVDDRKDNIAVAESIGMNTIHFRNMKQFREEFYNYDDSLKSLVSGLTGEDP